MSQDHLFLGRALTMEPLLPRHAGPAPRGGATGGERLAFERLCVRRRWIEMPTLRMALPTALPGHVD